MEYVDFISTVGESYQSLLNAKACVSVFRDKWFKRLMQMRICGLQTQVRDIREALCLKNVKSGAP